MLQQGDGSPKVLGVYYTASQVVGLLVWWGSARPSDTVLDPSFGGGVFLPPARCANAR